MLNEFPRCPRPLLPHILPNRVAYAESTGVNSDFTIAFSGSPPPQNAWVVAYVWNSAPVTYPWITGGVNPWDDMGGNVNNMHKHLLHRATSTEPSSYTVHYAGASKLDACGCLMLEFLGMAPIQPDAHGVTTGSSANATSLISVSGRGTLIATVMSDPNFDLGGGHPLVYDGVPDTYDFYMDQYVTKIGVLGGALFRVCMKPVDYASLEISRLWPDPDPASTPSASVFTTMLKAAIQ